MTQRREGDEVNVSGVFEGRTTGSPIGLIIHNGDQRSKDYGDIRDQFRPGHADFTYWQKYGLRDYRGGGRPRPETAMRVAAGAIARVILRELPPAPIIVRGALVAMGGHGLDHGAWDWGQVAENAFFAPMPRRRPLGLKRWINFERTATPRAADRSGRRWCASRSGSADLR